MYAPFIRLKPNGVPHLSALEIDRIGERFLKEAFPGSTATGPDQTDLGALQKMMENEGYTFLRGILSVRGNLLGLTVFQAGDLPVLEPDGSMRRLSVGPKTIVTEERLWTPAYERIRRFTLAHEIGHQVFHRTYGTDPVNMEKYREDSHKKMQLADSQATLKLLDEHRLQTDHDWVEWQANAFASAILMPETRLKQVAEAEREASVSETEYINSLLTDTMDVFNVSKAAAFYRLKKKGHLPENCKVLDNGMLGIC